MDVKTEFKKWFEDENKDMDIFDSSLLTMEFHRFAECVERFMVYYLIKNQDRRISELTEIIKKSITNDPELVIQAIKGLSEFLNEYKK